MNKLDPVTLQSTAKACILNGNNYLPGVKSEVKGSNPCLNTTPLPFQFFMSAALQVTTFVIRPWELHSVSVRLVYNSNYGFNI